MSERKDMERNKTEKCECCVSAYDFRNKSISQVCVNRNLQGIDYEKYGNSWTHHSFQASQDECFITD